MCTHGREYFYGRDALLQHHLMAVTHYNSRIHLHTYTAGSWWKTQYTTGTDSQNMNDFAEEAEKGNRVRQVISVCGDDRRIFSYGWPERPWQGEKSVLWPHRAWLCQGNCATILTLHCLKTQSTLPFSIPFFFLPLTESKEELGSALHSNDVSSPEETSVC